MWEAFLLQMDDFDTLLEFLLRRKLDALVAAPVPVRRGRAGWGRLKKSRGEANPKAIGGTPIELRPETLVLLERS